MFSIYRKLYSRQLNCYIFNYNSSLSCAFAIQDLSQFDKFMMVLSDSVVYLPIIGKLKSDTCEFISVDTYSLFKFRNVSDKTFRKLLFIIAKVEFNWLVLYISIEI